MNVAKFIYPSLIASAVAVVASSIPQPIVALVAIFLAFLFQLLVLVGLRRNEAASVEITAQLQKLDLNTRDLQQSQAELNAARTLSLDLQQKLATAELALEKSTIDAKAYADANSRLQKSLAEAKVGDEQAVIQFVRNLQSRGRFLDFLMADIHKLADPQVGAAARVVHQGLRSMVQDYFQIEPISELAEGSSIDIPQDELGRRYKLLQSRGETVPTSGLLIHKGWQTGTLKLPQSQKIETAEERRVLAPAEIDVGGSH